MLQTKKSVGIVERTEINSTGYKHINIYISRLSKCSCSFYHEIETA